MDWSIEGGWGLTVLSWLLLKVGKSYSLLRNMSLTAAAEEVRKDKAESPNNGL